MTSQFYEDTTPIVASLPSPFASYLMAKNCPDANPTSPPASCDLTGTAEEWIFSTFGEMWVPEHIKYDIIYLVGAVAVAKMLTMYGLKRKNYMST